MTAPASKRDPESRLARDDHASLRLWLRLFTSTTMIERELSTRLKAEFNCTLPRFDLLAQLDRAPRGLRMTELSERLLVTGGNVTWLVTSLNNEGLVNRHRTPADRRAVVVRLTAAGRRAFTAMARSHEQWVTELLRGISARDQRVLYAQLGLVKQHVAHCTTPRTARQDTKQ